MTPLPEAATHTNDESASSSESSSSGSATTVFVIAMVATALIALIGGVVWAVMSGGSREAQTVIITVPQGTSVRLAMGEEINIMPTRLEFYVGDTILIRNDDVVEHSVGPYMVAAGDEMRLRYGAPGIYEGYCPLSIGERYEIVVNK